ncbi:MAG: hypothetical protein MZV49_04940 [Rhodopseudomonas palustris]|nr:hypothetical protein [Rhodopseudomonas palustris]
MSGLWCVNRGLRPRGTGRRRVRGSCASCRYYNSFFQCAHPPAIELARELCELDAAAASTGCSSPAPASEANDTVIRLVRCYWSLLGKPEQARSSSARRNGYHGSTVGAASLGGMPWMHAQAACRIPDILHIEQPYWFGAGGDSARPSSACRIARQLEPRSIEEAGAEQGGRLHRRAGAGRRRRGNPARHLLRRRSRRSATTTGSC